MPDRREPTARLRLRWGSYRERYLLGLTLVVGGLVHLQSASTQWLLPLLVGTAAHTAGWWVMPAAGWRRNLVVWPSGITLWLLLVGPQGCWVLAVPYACWLLVRHRPPRSYLTVPLVAAGGILSATLFDEYAEMPAALAISGAAAVAAAWAAAALPAGSTTRRIPSQTRA